MEMSEKNIIIERQPVVFELITDTDNAEIGGIFKWSGIPNSGIESPKQMPHNGQNPNQNFI